MRSRVSLPLAALLVLAACSGPDLVVPDDLPAAIGPGAVVGRVVDDDGAGLEGVQLRLFREAYPTATTFTDAAGEFRFDSVAPGRWELRLTPPAGFRMEPGAASTRVVTVPDGAAAMVAEFHLVESTGAITGVVYWRDSPRAGARLALESGAVAVTDTSGYYRFASLPAGSYTVTLTPPPGFLLPEEWPSSHTLAIERGGTGLLDWQLGQRVVVELAGRSYGELFESEHGAARTWVEVDGAGELTALGVSITAELATGSATSFESVGLALPPAGLFDHVILTLHWATHFYMIRPAEREQIPGGYSPAEQDAVHVDYRPDGLEMADDLGWGPWVIGGIGLIWYPASGPSLNWISDRGAWVGLHARHGPARTGAIPQPARYQRTGAWPTEYGVVYDQARNQYDVYLSGFVPRTTD